MKKIFLLLTVILIHGGIRAQQTEILTLDKCLKIAEIRNPLNKQKDIAGKSLAYKLQNLSTSWYPGVGFNAQAIYNSETVNFSDFLKNTPVVMPSLPLDQYKVWADINQQIYDGGTIKAQKNIEKITLETELRQIEADLLSVKQRTCQVYFSLLITMKSQDILLVSLDELKERKKVIRSGVDNGVLLKENLLSMEAEELKLEEKLLELNLARQQLLNTLSVLMDSSLSANTVIIAPEDPVQDDTPNSRPEYALFEMQKLKFDANQKLVSAKNLPRLFAFSQLAYGRPGYNIISRDFHTFYSVGVGMKWNFLNYGNNQRQKKLFELQKNRVDIQRENFDDQVKIQSDAEQVNMLKYNEILEKDNQILQLRKAITATSFAKLTNGIITATDYLLDLNTEMLAQLQYESHKILKLQSAYNYLLIEGKI
jgi:outer membrane protein TolC